MRTAYIIVKAWPGGKRENVKAYLNEENAKYQASKIISEEWSIYLQTVEIELEENEKPSTQMNIQWEKTERKEDET